MERAILFMGLIMVIFCGSGHSAIDFYSNNTVQAEYSGGESLQTVTGGINMPCYSDGKLNVIYGGGAAAVDVKDISMNSVSYLVLTDENGRKYPTVLETTNSLHLPSESNVIMRSSGDVYVTPDNPGSPKVGWQSYLEFPDDLNLTGLNLSSSLEDVPAQDLQKLDTYCEDRGIGYTTGYNAHFSDSNDDVGVTCRWGEGEHIAVGISN